MSEVEKRWGFLIDDRFIEVPKTPLQLAGYDKPPFTVILPTGVERHIIEEPNI